ncbi:MAG: MaoC/PaaZ C-terminal domain-containing protein [Gammaproteobacteria bacterium]
MNSYSWSDLHVGMSHSFSAVVTASMMRHFLEDSGDDNPLHVDASFAREQGFDDVVVYGLLSASYYSTLVGVYLPGRHAVLQGIQVDFVRPIYVDMPLKVRGEILHLSDAVRRVEIVARIESDSGEVLSKAKLKIGVRD